MNLLEAAAAAAAAAAASRRAKARIRVGSILTTRANWWPTRDCACHGNDKRSSVTCRSCSWATRHLGLWAGPNSCVFPRGRAPPYPTSQLPTEPANPTQTHPPHPPVLARGAAACSCSRPRRVHPRASRDRPSAHRGARLSPRPTQGQVRDPRPGARTHPRRN